MAAKWEPNREEIQRTVTGHGRTLVSGVLRGTVNWAKFRVPRKTGRLANSIGSSIRESPNRVKGEAGTRVKYGLVVHDGAKAHTIKPRRAKALRFYWERVGGVVILKSVRHPGVGATPYLTSSLLSVAPAHGFKVVVERKARRRFL